LDQHIRAAQWNFLTFGQGRWKCFWPVLHHVPEYSDDIFAEEVPASVVQDTKKTYNIAVTTL